MELPSATFNNIFHTKKRLYEGFGQLRRSIVDLNMMSSFLSSIYLSIHLSTYLSFSHLLLFLQRF